MEDKHLTPSPALLAFYNAIPNVVWSVLSLGPLSVFCYQHMARPWLYGALAVSLLGYAVPRAWFRWWQLSGSAAAYRRLGVHVANQFTQHGSFINGLLRRRYPHYRHVQSRAAVAALWQHTYHLEQFHLVGFLFFLFAAGYAAAMGRVGWGLALSVLNMLYNVYPMWLQQYIRVRLGGAHR
ncbi:hypothetical protein [Hymenobacter profundi]|uniref:Glycosyl-4,4'-diaponeurosporenoate acyltransferase n=1 Tax=Hymenobacter profundi TaxID=1982110 RepID=A0ABS6WWT3_9BACT|nr:hypothetical protein [Hymenobacter profundi]MBW3128030.1 hypothetical protein [Hymenobacter profundi]